MLRSVSDTVDSLSPRPSSIAQVQDTPWRRRSSALPGNERLEGTPWWAWWNLLSLDAPTVSLLWALLFTRSAGIALTLPVAAVLLLTVWTIYVTDRLLDGWHPSNSSPLQTRHRFCAAHTTQLLFLAPSAAVVALCLTAKFLSPAEVRGGEYLSVVVALYMLGIHAGRRWISRVFPKELIIGFLFAAGTSLPVWSADPVIFSKLLLPMVLFALLCSLNCLSIECWETCHLRDISLSIPHSVRWANLRINYLAAASVGSALGSLFLDSLRPSSAPLLLAIALAALLILTLNCYRQRLSRRALRVLVDLALVVAALFALLLPS